MPEIEPATLPVELQDLRPGDRMPEAQFGPVTRTAIVRYAGAGGDFNPIHHDEEFARQAGMPSVFAMGMLHAGVLGERLARWVGPLNLRSFTVRFTGQVWPGDELTLRGEVEDVSAEGDAAAMARISLTVSNQDGGAVLEAAATAVVRGGVT